MKKIVLVYPKLGLSFTGRPPLPILCLAAYLERAGLEVSVFDLNQEANWPEKLLKAAGEALCVGVSAITGNQIKNGLEITKLIKKDFLHLPVIWGGVNPSLVHEETLKEDGVDIVVRGEGEETLLDLARALMGEKNLSDVLGISFKKDGRIVHNPPRGFLEMDNLPNPAWHFIDINNYYFSNLSSKNVALQTSRGCPFRCEFCYNFEFNKNRWRKMSAKRILEMIIPLKEKHQINGVVFWDDNFFVDFKRVEEFCRLLIDRNLIIKCAELTAKFGFNVWYAFMIGFPEETEEDISLTIKMMKKVKQINPLANTAIKVFSPFPGTPLYQKAKQAGFVLPKSLMEWGDYRPEDVKTPWTKHKFSPYFPLLTRFATEYDRFSGLFKNPFLKSLAKTFHLMEKFRWDYEFYHFPIELILVKKIAGKLGYL